LHSFKSERQIFKLTLQFAIASCLRLQSQFCQVWYWRQNYFYEVFSKSFPILKLINCDRLLKLQTLFHFWQTTTCIHYAQTIKNKKQFTLHPNIQKAIESKALSNVAFLTWKSTLMRFSGLLRFTLDWEFKYVWKVLISTFNYYTVTSEIKFLFGLKFADCKFVLCHNKMCLNIKSHVYCVMW